MTDIKVYDGLLFHGRSGFERDVTLKHSSRPPEFKDNAIRPGEFLHAPRSSRMWSDAPEGNQVGVREILSHVPLCLFHLCCHGFSGEDEIHKVHLDTWLEGVLLTGKLFITKNQHGKLTKEYF